MVPPECAGLGARELGAKRPGEVLVCATCGVVEATPEQVEQARAAARVDGTWPDPKKEGPR
jgi:hypothetical protein